MKSIFNSFVSLLNISFVFAIQNYDFQKKPNKISGKLVNDENSILN